MNPYRQCPIYQDENYRIRFVKQSDANDLLKVYSDPKTVALCNCDKDRKSTRLNSSHSGESRMPSSA